MSLHSVGSAKAKMLAVKDWGKSLQQRSLAKAFENNTKWPKVFFENETHVTEGLRKVTAKTHVSD